MSPRGGPRVNSGPTADPKALRRARKDDQQSWILLPVEGRKGNAPAFPLAKWKDLHPAPKKGSEDYAQKQAEHVAARKWDDRELTVWRQIWKTPQAAQWDRLGWKADVALYVRMLVGAEAGNMKAAGEARQWSDRLGLTQMAMLRNRWKIAADEVKEKRETKPKKETRSSSKNRLHIVSNSGTGL